MNQKGSSSFRNNNNTMMVFQSVPELPNNARLNQTAQSTFSTNVEPPSRLLRRRKLTDAITFEIRTGDLTEETSDAIVNAANGRLSHGAGVAGAISIAGGPTIQAESSEWIAEHGEVMTGNVAHTSAGDLSAKYVIHAVGPVWSSFNAAKCESQLRMTVLNSLKCASRLGLTSISMPAISAGIYGFPKGYLHCDLEVTGNVSMLN